MTPRGPLLKATKTIAKWITLSVVALAAASALGGCAYRAYRHRQIDRATAIDPARGVDDALFTRIGGIEQWLTIRGQNRANPVLLLLHGGPGLALSVVPRSMFADWTHDFTLVQWDQRGAGRTFGRSGPLAAGVTIDRMALDGLEVAEFLGTRLHAPKIVLVGVSWGSILGVHMVKTRPDLFSAFVGTGMVVNHRDGRAIAYRQLLAEARTRNNRRAVEELEANGPPPYASMAKATVHTRWANTFEPGAPSRWDALRMVLFESNAGLADLRDYARGLKNSDDHFREEGDRVDLRSLGTNFDVPFFVFQGAADNVAPPSLARAYVDAISAPHKEFAAIANAGHNAAATRGAEFLALLRERVRPFALMR
ncbi:MAG TPA: alpha/beta hydrolase [Vicinamibacterales bacterium]|nr:alpha/beta hydrolase [Vicinamibacterales bacterium]